MSVKQAEQLPELETPEGSRVAFGRYVKRAIYDIEGDLQGTRLTPEEIKWFSADTVADICFKEPEPGKRFEHPYFAGVPLPSGEPVVGVLLSPVEWRILVRSPKLLGKIARDTTLASADIDEDLLAASDRSATHAREAKIESMESYTNKLLEREAVIKILLREARSGGMAHFGPAKLKGMINESWQEVLNFIDLMQVQNKWDDEQKKHHINGAIFHLTSGAQPQRIQRWQNLLGVQLGYLDARANIFQRQTKRTTKVLTE